MSDINTAGLDSLKVLDPNRPIREADKGGRSGDTCRAAAGNAKTESRSARVEARNMKRFMGIAPIFQIVIQLPGAVFAMEIYTIVDANGLTSPSTRGVSTHAELLIHMAMRHPLVRLFTRS